MKIDIDIHILFAIIPKMITMRSNTNIHILGDYCEKKHE